MAAAYFADAAEFVAYCAREKVTMVHRTIDIADAHDPANGILADADADMITLWERWMVMLALDHVFVSADLALPARDDVTRALLHALGKDDFAAAVTGGNTTHGALTAKLCAAWANKVPLPTMIEVMRAAALVRLAAAGPVAAETAAVLLKCASMIDALVAWRGRE